MRPLPVSVLTKGPAGYRWVCACGLTMLATTRREANKQRDAHWNETHAPKRRKKASKEGE